MRVHTAGEKTSRYYLRSARCGRVKGPRAAQPDPTLNASGALDAGALLTDADGRIFACDEEIFGRPAHDAPGLALGELANRAGEETGAGGVPGPTAVSIIPAEVDGEAGFAAVAPGAGLGHERAEGAQAATRFVQAVSHDLHEPLRTVIAFCELALRECADALRPKGRRHISKAIGAAVQMRTLLEGIGQAARVGAHRNESRWFDPGEPLDHALASLDHCIRSSSAKITKAPLPAMFGDPLSFQSLFQNLISNALKHARPGTAPRIHVSAKPDGDVWVFSVSDNGPGVRAPDRRRVFEPYVRLDSAPEAAGSGLGLTICRRIVEDLGGRIWVSPAPGGGSSFRFALRNPPRAPENG
ncbi:MAG: hypothetical protein JO303_15780 [Caulobacteraceae bacterium]|nr:hypothetical protein [Caulobacteraceae bacterium]